MAENILEIEQLSLSVDERQILENVSFSIKDDCITCLVGASGSGKSMTMAAVLGLLPVEAQINPESKIHFYGTTVFSIYQDAINSFNGSVKVGKQLYQMAKGYKRIGRLEFDREITEIMKRLRFHKPEMVLQKYPFELSGGMLQRLMIACAIYVAPDLIIADEPTTALDVSIQKEIMREFRAIHHQLHTAILVVTHDFGVVAELADEVVVMHDGVVVEAGDVFEIFDHPKEAYTKSLLEASFKEEITSC